MLLPESGAHQTDPGIFLRIFLTDLIGAVIASVIHHQDLDVPVRLDHQTLYTLADVPLRIVDRNDDADQCIFHFLSPEITELSPRILLP